MILWICFMGLDPLHKSRDLLFVSVKAFLNSWVQIGNKKQWSLSKKFSKKETQSNFWNEIKTFLIRSFERNFFCSTTPDNGHKTRAQEDEDNTGGLHRPFGGIEKSMAVRNWDDGRLLRIWNEFPETKSWKQINEFEEDFDWTINSVWKINFSTFAKI